MRYLLLCDLDSDRDGTGTESWEDRSDIRVRISSSHFKCRFLHVVLKFSQRSDVYIDCFLAVAILPACAMSIIRI